MCIRDRLHITIPLHADEEVSPLVRHVIIIFIHFLHLMSGPADRSALKYCGQAYNLLHSVFPYINPDCVCCVFYEAGRLEINHCGQTKIMESSGSTQLID